MRGVPYRAWPLWLMAMVMLCGCDSPLPTAVKTAPPVPPPPAPAPVAASPPVKPQPDPYEKAMSAVSAIVRRYGNVYASVKDEATADKAVQEIGQMTAGLRELTGELGKMPYRPGQEKHAVTLQTELVQLQTAQLSNPDMLRVLSDPELGFKFVAAHQSFVTEGLLPLGQVVVTRQPSAPEAQGAAPAPSGGGSTK